MPFRLLAALAVGVSAPFAAGLAAAEPTRLPPSDPSAGAFTTDAPLPRFSVQVDDANLKSLRGDPRKYARCTVTVDGQTLKDVGVHVKGAAGSTRGWDDKPALTLNFDLFVAGQTWRGLDKIHLNNSVQDWTYLNEILCSELASAMGLPAARAAHAVVELNGRKVGLYVMKEGFNGNFVKRYFPKQAQGNLYDGGFLTDIDGNLKLDSGKDVKLADLKAVVKACQEGDPKKRTAAVSKLVDVEQFYTNAALQILGTDWDGYMRNRNNYRVYVPKDGRAVFIPHGMDQMFGNPGEGVWNGWGGMAARAVLDTPEGKRKTLEKLKEMNDKYMTPEKTARRIDEWVKHTKPGLAAQNKDWAAQFENATRDLKNRLRDRHETVKRELPKLLK